MQTISEQGTLILESSSERENAEQESENLKSLEVQRVRIEKLENELEKLTFEKVISELEKLKQIESLIIERDELVEECNTIKETVSELEEQNESLTQLLELIGAESDEEHVDENEEESEPDVRIDDELEDTSNTICTEEMKLKKCTPCRRRFHASCIDKWLDDNNTCPTCRATWNN